MEIYITVDGTNQELFVHVTGLVDQIRDGDKVTFEDNGSKVILEFKTN